MRADWQDYVIFSVIGFVALLWIVLVSLGVW